MSGARTEIRMGRSVGSRADQPVPFDGSHFPQWLDQARSDVGITVEFPAEVEQAAQHAATQPSSLPDLDMTDLPFVTIDPPGAKDLDQAVHLERAGSGFRVRYAIADVPAFVEPGGLIDNMARTRGQTMYAPDRKAPLHPAAISEDAASLLPNQARPAFVWDIAVDASGHVGRVDLQRAMVKSRAQLTYQQVQTDLDAGKDVGFLSLLPDIGALRVQAEIDRGGASLNMPSQEIERTESGEFTLQARPTLPIETHNAHISLMTGMAAGHLMLQGGVGIVRTMPAPTAQALDDLKKKAVALQVPWGPDDSYGAVLRRVDPANPRHLAFLYAATSVFRGAGYTVIQQGTVEGPLTQHAALAATYAHVTAPLRRLVDRFGLVICESIAAGREVPVWASQALPLLPELMRQSDRRAKALERASVTIAEALVLQGSHDKTYRAVVVSEPHPQRRIPGSVHLLDLPIEADCRRCGRLGEEMTVKVVRADPQSRRVEFEVVP